MGWIAIPFKRRIASCHIYTITRASCLMHRISIREGIRLRRTIIIFRIQRESESVITNKIITGAPWISPCWRLGKELDSSLVLKTKDWRRELNWEVTISHWDMIAPKARKRALRTATAIGRGYQNVFETPSVYSLRLGLNGELRSERCWNDTKSGEKSEFKLKPTEE